MIARQRSETVRKEVVFNLDTTRKVELGQENADIDGAIAELEVEKKTVTDQYKSKIDGLSKRRQENSAIIRAGVETRTVECQLVKNFEARVIEYWHEGVMVEERTMTEQELQYELELKEKERKSFKQIPTESEERLAMA